MPVTTTAPPWPSDSVRNSRMAARSWNGVGGGGQGAARPRWLVGGGGGGGGARCPGRGRGGRCGSLDAPAALGEETAGRDLEHWGESDEIVSVYPPLPVFDFGQRRQ